MFKKAISILMTFVLVCSLIPVLPTCAEEMPYGLIGFRYRCGAGYPGHIMYDGGGNAADTAISNVGPWVYRIDDFHSRYTYETGGALNDSGIGAIWAGRGIFNGTFCGDQVGDVGIPRVGEVPWWTVTYDDDPNKTEDELREIATHPEKGDLYLAMCILVEIAEGYFDGVAQTDLFHSRAWAKLTAATILVPFWYEYFYIDSTTGYMMIRDINNNHDATCYAYYDSEKITAEQAKQYEAEFNQGIITMLEILDTYMHWEKTGELLADTRTGNTAKELLANKYPEDNLKVSPSPVVPREKWGWKVKSVGGNPINISSLQSNFWVDDMITWIPSAPPSGYISITKTAEDQSVNGNARTVQGIQFTVTNLETNESFTGITDGNGSVVIEVPPGTYKVDEGVPPKYQS